MQNIPYTDLRWPCSKKRISLGSSWWTSYIEQSYGIFYSSLQSQRKPTAFSASFGEFYSSKFIDQIKSQVLLYTPVVNTIECLTCLGYPNSQQYWQTKLELEKIQCRTERFLVGNYKTKHNTSQMIQIQKRPSLYRNL